MGYICDSEKKKKEEGRKEVHMIWHMRLLRTATFVRIYVRCVAVKSTYMCYICDRGGEKREGRGEERCT